MSRLHSSRAAGSSACRGGAVQSRSKDGRCSGDNSRTSGGIVCVGAACKYFCSEEEWAGMHKRLIPLNGDDENLVDRYDVRLLLNDPEALNKKKKTYSSDRVREILGETPALDRERYRDLPSSNLFEDEVLERLRDDRGKYGEAWTPTRELQRLREQTARETRDRRAGGGGGGTGGAGFDDASVNAGLGDMSAVPPPAALDAPVDACGRGDAWRGSPREAAENSSEGASERDAESGSERDDDAGGERDAAGDSRSSRAADSDEEGAGRARSRARQRPRGESASEDDAEDRERPRRKTERESARGAEERGTLWRAAEEEETAREERRAARVQRRGGQGRDAGDEGDGSDEGDAGGNSRASPPASRAGERPRGRQNGGKRERGGDGVAQANREDQAQPRECRHPFQKEPEGKRRRAAGEDAREFRGEDRRAAARKARRAEAASSEEEGEESVDPDTPRERMDGGGRPRRAQSPSPPTAEASPRAQVHAERKEGPGEEDCFVPPFWLPRDKIPHLPRTLKEHLVIECTAHFVRTEGSRMEFRLKLDPAASAQLRFLHVDHPLHPYYAYLRQTGEALLLHAPSLLPPKLLFFSKLVYTHLPAWAAAAKEDPLEPRHDGATADAQADREEITDVSPAGAAMRKAKREGGARVGEDARPREEKEDEEERPSRDAAEGRWVEGASAAQGEGAQAARVCLVDAGGQGKAKARVKTEEQGGAEKSQSPSDVKASRDTGHSLLLQAKNEEDEGGVSLLMSYGSDDEGDAADEDVPEGDIVAEDGAAPSSPSAASPTWAAKAAKEETAAAAPPDEEDEDEDNELDAVWQSGKKLRVAFALESRKVKPRGGTPARAGCAPGVLKIISKRRVAPRGASESAAPEWAVDERDPDAVVAALDELPELPWAKPNDKLKLTDVSALIIHQIGCWLLVSGEETMVDFALQMTSEDSRFFFLDRTQIAFCYFRYVLRSVLRAKKEGRPTAKAPAQLTWHPVTRAFLARLRFEHHLSQKKVQTTAEGASHADGDEVLTESSINEHAAAAAAASSALAAEAAAIEERRTAEALALRDMLAGAAGAGFRGLETQWAPEGSVVCTPGGAPQTLAPDTQNSTNPVTVAEVESAAESTTESLNSASAQSYLSDCNGDDAQASLAARDSQAAAATPASQSAPSPSASGAWAVEPRGDQGAPAAAEVPEGCTSPVEDPAALVARAVADPSYVPTAVSLLTTDMYAAGAAGDAPRYAILYAAYCQLCTYVKAAAMPSSVSTAGS
ncbi:hypothetical protein BESB_037500 [Besnoitia besnoiti]|uniref:SURP motif domain-containing protein n=1 Tax=Besnoitia besnoiti TaxID=94643 RepID=A0A2A9MNM2_BESBE|nr:hypothetical protein BESB_037500 [Besnoitia besnoiti]PFH37292.1 hypothetical protein BESB_037500 [Besnoitia besnoiti]